MSAREDVFRDPVDVELDQLRARVVADRERVAQWMIAHGYATGHGDSIEDLLVELSAQYEEELHFARPPVGQG